MRQIRALIYIALFSFVANLIVAEMNIPAFKAKCAECGNGPKDRKCPDGQKCADGNCVKK
jgi:hypothetical protein